MILNAFGQMKNAQDTIQFEQFKWTYDIRLNAQQEKAVCKSEGPALLLAVPGSGKTTVIVARVGYMLFCAGIHPANILTLTFSKAAASEMKERFCHKFGEDAASSLHFSTIHSFCLTVIRQAASAYGIHIPLLETHNENIIRKVFFNRFYEYPSDIATKELSRYIGYCKNSMYTEDQIETIGTPSFDFKRFYEEYEEYKRKNDRIDFDDQLLLAYELLCDHPDMLEAIQARYHYVNVDEAQDTSLIQHKIIQKITERTHNLFMVGDEDQSIYGFRAAYPDALLHFKKDHPSAEILLMETNYRCASNIVMAADSFIRQNRSRYEKTMRSARGEGKIKETKLGDAGQQYRYLLESLKKAHLQGRQVAVLYRNNESAVPLVDLLNRDQVPFNGDVSMSYFQHILVKDMTCALRLACDPNDLDAYKQIYYKLGLYTTKAQYKSLYVLFQKNAADGDGRAYRVDIDKNGLDNSKRRNVFENRIHNSIFTALAAIVGDGESMQHIQTFSTDLRRIQKLPPLDAMKAIDALFYRSWIKHLEADGRDSIHSMDQKMSTLYALAAEHKTIGSFLERIRELSALRMPDPCDSPSSFVTLSTIHSSKGMEFDKVILLDVIRGILPSEKGSGALGVAGVNPYEEEVRLFYVGITRAKNEIEVITSRKRFGKPIESSPFVLDLLGKGPKTDKPKKYGDSAGAGMTAYNADPMEDAYQPGTRILHTSFGHGTIINRTGDILSIRFDDNGDKKMLLSGCLRWGYLQPEG